MKRRERIPRRFDPNVHIAYVAGQRARLEGKPVTRCPNLIPQFGEVYSAELMDAWMRGWNDRDHILKQPKLPLTEAQP